MAYIKKGAQTEIGKKVEKLAQEVPAPLSWFLPDPYDPSSMIHPVGGLARPVKGIFKSKLLSDLAVTPERKVLWGKTKEHLRNLLLNKKTAPDEAYLFGSYPTKKLNPKDIDVFSLYPKTSVGEQRKRAATELLAGLDIPLDYGTYTSGSSGTALQQFLKAGGKQRYGDEGQWIKILGLLGLLGIEQNQEREGR